MTVPESAIRTEPNTKMAEAVRVLKKEAARTTRVQAEQEKQSQATASKRNQFASSYNHAQCDLECHSSSG